MKRKAMMRTGTSRSSAILFYDSFNTTLVNIGVCFFCHSLFSLSGRDIRLHGS